jgi:hypothetical protein
LGWLHWSEEQLFFSDINSIHTGYAGMQTMLTSIFGENKQANSTTGPTAGLAAGPAGPPTFINTAPAQVMAAAPVVDLPPLTPAAFDRMFPADLTAKAN